MNKIKKLVTVGLACAMVLGATISVQAAGPGGWADPRCIHHPTRAMKWVGMASWDSCSSCGSHHEFCNYECPVSGCGYYEYKCYVCGANP